ncbi:MAG: 2-succinyl-5-enolpyruvyl-6-hydroxy-3-cyclohexene-1-carboxylic-acid synthase [Actinomycetales bacterium]|nr:2-succinyl-5-enolpyruvyl-6-hydroxy-3-cyclohexene-1-carboxylic-acid synthase [Actinomycetales bacterium]
MEATTSSARAVHVLRTLLAGGVRDVVLAPGSRSAPFALALYAADAAGALRLHVRLDERTAGFLALGLTIGSRRPVAVVTTSGTAVGNLMPAIMEAHHAGRPVVVVSADRPTSARGTGANQTTWQDGIFGRFARCADLGVDAAAAAVERVIGEALASGGPAHINVQFDTPLVPDPAVTWWPATAAAESADESADGDSAAAAGPPPNEAGLGGAAGGADEPQPLATGPRTVVVAGDDAGPAARVLAESAGWPLLAEPTSGARAGAHAIRTYRLLLGTELGAAIERVVVVGHPTLSRPVTALLSRQDVELIAVRTRTGVATDPVRRARVLAGVPTVVEPDGPAARAQWMSRWWSADGQLAAVIDAHVDALPELHPLQVAAELSLALGPGQNLVVGSSNPIRDLDLMLMPYRPRERRRIVANRGLAGIDGTISTAIGVDLGRAGAARSLAVMGDLTFLHDQGGLFAGADEPRPDLTIVIVNDDGGSIFSALEQGAPAYQPAFERVFATPQHADFAALCAASGTAYRLVESRRALREQLADHRPGLRVLEARVGRGDRRETAATLSMLAERTERTLAHPGGGMP